MEKHKEEIISNLEQEVHFWIMEMCDVITIIQFTAKLRPIIVVLPAHQYAVVIKPVVQMITLFALMGSAMRVGLCVVAVYSI